MPLLPRLLFEIRDHRAQLRVFGIECGEFTGVTQSDGEIALVLGDRDKRCQGVPETILRCNLGRPESTFHWRIPGPGPDAVATVGKASS